MALPDMPDDVHIGRMNGERKCLRGLVDNDSQEILVAALVHDANFAAHLLDSFDLSNELFYQMIRLAGGSWWLAQKAYWAVQLFGMEAWNQDLTDIKLNRMFVKRTWGPK